MRKLDDWFQAQRRADERRTSIEDVLLTHKLGSYAWHRLKFFLLRFVVDDAAHLIEFAFLSFVLPRQLLIPALAFRAASMLAGALWWGGLEVLRERIRELQASAKGYLLAREVSKWLGAALAIALATFAAAVAFLLTSVWLHFGVLQLYLFAVLVSTSLNFVSRTLHSGIYAIRRVYRPLWAMIAVDLSSVAAVFALWPACGAWSVPIVVLWRAVASHALTCYWAWKSYVLAGYTPLNIELSRQTVSVLRTMCSAEFALSSLASGVLALEALVVLLLFRSATSSQNHYELFLIFYLISPQIRATHEWARLFYFDFKQLNLDWFRGLRSMFQRLVFKLAWLVAAALWASCWVVPWIFDLRGIDGTVVLLLPLFVVRSLLAFIQVRAFAERRFFDLIASGALLLLGACLVWTVASSTQAELLLMTALLLAAFLFLRAQPFGVLGRNDLSVVTPMTHWIRDLMAEQNWVEARVARLAASLPPFETRKLAARIARKLGSGGCVSMLDHRRIIWFSRGRDAIPRDWLALTSAGLVEELQTAASEAGGGAALRLLAESHLLKDYLSASWVGGPSRDDSQLNSDFKLLFPEGFSIDTRGPDAGALATLPPADRRGVIAAALRYVSGFTFRPARLPFDISATVRDSELATIFAAPKGADRKLLREWAKAVQASNFRSAAAGRRFRGPIRS